MFKAIRAFSEPNNLVFRDTGLTSFIQESIRPGSHVILKNGAAGIVVNRTRIFTAESNKDTITIKVVHGPHKGKIKVYNIKNIRAISNEKIAEVPHQYFSVHQRLRNGKIVSRRTLSVHSPVTKTRFFNDKKKTITIVLGHVPDDQKKAIATEIKRITKKANASITVLQADPGPALCDLPTITTKDVIVLGDNNRIYKKSTALRNTEKVIGLGKDGRTIWGEQLDRSDLIISVGSVSLKKLSSDELNLPVEKITKKELKQIIQEEVSPYVSEMIRRTKWEDVVDYHIIGRTCYLLTNPSYKFREQKAVKKRGFRNDWIMRYDIARPETSIKDIATGFDTIGTTEPHRTMSLELIRTAWGFIKQWDNSFAHLVNQDEIIEKNILRLSGRLFE